MLTHYSTQKTMSVVSLFYKTFSLRHITVNEVYYLDANCINHSHYHLNFHL